MELWDRLRSLFRIMRGTGLQRYELTGRLQTVLRERTDREQRPSKELEEQLLAVGLEHLRAADRLKQQWEHLSDREKELTALTCQGYTNRQIAARLGISEQTVRGYMRQIMFKCNLHSKVELRILFKEWDFSEWAPPAL